MLLREILTQSGSGEMAQEFYITNESTWLSCVSHCQDIIENGEKLKVVVKNASKRSLSQNATMWMWLGELSHQIKLKTSESYSTDDLHEYFKARFCPSKELRFGDKEINVTSTTRLDTGEMHFYMNQIHEWSINAGFNLTIPINSEYREIMERQNA